MWLRVRLIVPLSVLLSIAGSACARVEPPIVRLASAESFLAPHPIPGGPRPALVADVRPDVNRIRAFRAPGGVKPLAQLDNPDPYGFRRLFLVKQVTDGWLNVYLPMRPNGSTGWIRESEVKVRPTSYRVVVDLSTKQLTVFEGKDRVMREPVATGTGGTPTPTGLFYPIQLARMPLGSAYGPLIFGLSAYSEVLLSFGGGDGQVGIHGTNDPSSIGQEVSHGCIRMRNAAIRRLADILPLGSPIHIRD